MSIIKHIGDTVEKAGNAVDNLHTSDDERNKQLTERLKSDNLSDSWLTKNIRPMGLLWLMGLFTAMIVMFFLGQELPMNYMSIVSVLMPTVFSFYYVGRSIDKNIKEFRETARKDVKTEASIERKDARIESREERRSNRKTK